MTQFGRLALAIALCVMAWCLPGCGGSSGGSSSRSAFQVTATFDPYTGRAVQGYVGSLKITAQTGSDTPLGPFVLKRGDAPLEITGLKSGKTYRLVIEGLQGTNGTGSKVASATIERAATSGTTAVNIDTTTSEIASVTVAPGDVTLKGGQTQQYTFEAKNAAGATILTNAQDSSFSASVTPAVGSFNASTGVYSAPAVVTPGDVRLDVVVGALLGSAIIHLEQDSTSGLEVGLLWNADGRGLPGYAQSARLQVLDLFGQVVPGNERIQVRSSRSAYTEIVRFELPSGSYLLRAEAFADSDGSGSPLASADVPFVIEGGSAVVALDMDASSFLGTSLSVIARDPLSGFANVTSGLEMIEGQSLIVEPTLLNASGAALLGPSGIRGSVPGGTGVTFDTGHIRATTSGSWTLEFSLGDAPGPFRIPVVVRPIKVTGEVHWDELPAGTKSVRVLVNWLGGSRNVLVQKGNGPGKFSFNQPLILGISRTVSAQAYATPGGTGSFVLVQQEDYLGALPPALRIPRP